MDTATLKAQARALEQQGNAVEALETYHRILARLEGTPAIHRELPLYVKIGDLSLRTGNTAAAITMYERAGEHFATLGSAKSVIALCLKILRADPDRTDVYPKHARRMLQAGHAEATRVVLVDYAERAKLQKTLGTLRRLAGRSEAELTGLLEKFFETMDRRAEKRAEPPAARMPSPAEPPVPAVEQPMRSAVEAEASPVQPAVPEPGAEEEEQPDTDVLIVPVGEAETVQPLARHQESAPTPAERQEPEPPVEEHVPPPRAPEPPPPVPPKEVRPPLGPKPARRPLREVPMPAPARREILMQYQHRTRSRPVWFWPGIAAGVLAVAGAGVIGVGAITRGGELEPPQGAEPAPSPVSRAGSLAVGQSDTGAARLGVGDSGAALPLSGALTLDSAEQGAAQPPASRDTALPPESLEVLIDTVDAGVPDLPVSAALPIDRAIPEVETPSVQTARTPALPPGTTIQGSVIVIDRLPIDSVSEFAVGGRTGQRVVQRLQSGARVVLTVVPFQGAPGQGAGASIRVITVPGDTAVGTVRFADRLVSARAVVAPAVLEGLLGQLTEVR
jgi:hypothetical protein